MPHPRCQDPALWFAPPRCNQSCRILSNPFVNQASEQPRNQSNNPPTTPPASITRAATCRPCCACSPRLWPSHWQCCCSSPTPAYTPSPTGVCCETSEARFSQRPAARGCSGNPCAPASTSPNSKPCSNMVNILKQPFRIVGSLLEHRHHNADTHAHQDRHVASALTCWSPTTRTWYAT